MLNKEQMGKIISLGTRPADVVSGIKDQLQNDQGIYDYATSAGSLLSSLDDLTKILKPIPGLGSGAAVTSLIGDLAKAHDDYIKNRPISNETLCSLGADVAGLLALGTAIGMSPAVGAALAVAGAALTVFALMPPVSDTVVESMTQVVQAIQNTVAAMGDALVAFVDLGIEASEYIATALRDLYNSAQLLNPFKDPLTLDLDGDGIETVAASTTNPILFDHDGDGTKNGTGWIKADDGFLVLDRNNNGTIDSGQELFGDSTPLAGGGMAEDGFAALAQEDTNADGVVNNLDTRWSQLRVWQDLNQDGVSQAGELLTMRAFSTVPLCLFYTA